MPGLPDSPFVLPRRHRRVLAQEGLKHKDTRRTKIEPQRRRDAKVQRCLRAARAMALGGFASLRFELPAPPLRCVCHLRRCRRRRRPHFPSPPASGERVRGAPLREGCAFGSQSPANRERRMGGNISSGASRERRHRFRVHAERRRFSALTLIVCFRLRPERANTSRFGRLVGPAVFPNRGDWG